MNNENIHFENRLLAALAHGSIVAQSIGILVGILIYITQREKSRYAAFQALQAAVFQLLNFVIILSFWLIWGIFYGLSIVSFIKLTNANPAASPPALFWISLFSMAIPFIYALLVCLYGLWGAIRTWQGKDFRYLIIGSWLENSGLGVVD